MSYEKFIDKVGKDTTRPYYEWKKKKKKKLRI